MKEIVELLLEKNPQVRMVINCITLETVGETLSCIKEMQTERSEWKWESEVVQLGVSRSIQNLMGGHNIIIGCCLMVGVNAISEMVSSTVITAAVGTALSKAHLIPASQIAKPDTAA